MDERSPGFNRLLKTPICVVSAGGDIGRFLLTAEYMPPSFVGISGSLASAFFENLRYDFQ
jgi:hypothetical protein